MKKLFCLALILSIFVNVNTFSVTRKSSSGKKSSLGQGQAEPVRVVLRFLKEYANLGPGYIDDTNLISDKFRTKYYKEKEKYIEENGIMDYVPIVGGQNPSENYKLISYNPNTGIVVVKAVYSEGYIDTSKIQLKVKNINGKWIIDDYVQKY